MRREGREGGRAMRLVDPEWPRRSELRELWRRWQNLRINARKSRSRGPNRSEYRECCRLILRQIHVVRSPWPSYRKPTAGDYVWRDAPIPRGALAGYKAAMAAAYWRRLNDGWADEWDAY